MSRILVIEDDPAILRGLADNLAYESHEVLTATDGEAGYRLVREKKPDLVILDLMLPKLSGYAVCQKLRAEGIATPIVMLSAQGREADRVLGLDLGANDYITKPFSVRELLARIRAIFRQQQETLVERQRFDQEMLMASDVQRRLFPQDEPLLATLDYCGCCQPARSVSGDYYDFRALAAGQLGLVVADVAGKGMPAALLMASLHACVHTHAPFLGVRCSELVAKINTLLYETTAPERFATLFYAVYDDATRVLTYVNAGHPPPLLVRRTDASVISHTLNHAPAPPGACVRLDADTPPVGLFATIPAVQKSIRLAPGEWLLIFTDGLIEALNEQDEEFGEKRLLELVLQNRQRNAQEMRDAISGEVIRFTGGRGETDDITLVVARVL